MFLTTKDMFGIEFDFAPSALKGFWVPFTWGVAPGYFIARLQRFRISFFSWAKLLAQPITSRAFSALTGFIFHRRRAAS